MEHFDNLYEKIEAAFLVEKQDIKSYSPLTLAYIGDAIYEIVIRTIVVGKGNSSVNKLHKRSSRLVKAATQAQMIKACQEALTEEELAIYKRGRNAKSYTMAKNATMQDYRMATGFECLMGYLYMTGQMDRMITLIQAGLKSIDEA
jgi:ribonuclease-3 family protein